jgi:hypothetical protein
MSVTRSSAQDVSSKRLYAGTVPAVCSRLPARRFEVKVIGVLGIASVVQYVLLR